MRNVVEIYQLVGQSYCRSIVLFIFSNHFSFFFYFRSAVVLLFSFMVFGVFFLYRIGFLFLLIFMRL